MPTAPSSLSTPRPPPAEPSTPYLPLTTSRLSSQVGPDIDRRRFELIADNCRCLLTGEPLQYFVADKILGF